MSRGIHGSAVDSVLRARRDMMAAEPNLEVCVPAELLDIPLDSFVFTAEELLYEELVASLVEAGRVNVTEYRVLLKADEMGGQARIGKVAVALNLPQNVVSQAANRLEALGLVDRVADTDDARATVLAVTAEGRIALEHIDAAVSAHFDALWSLLPGEMASGYRDLIAAIGTGLEGLPSVMLGGARSTGVRSPFITTIAQSHEIIRHFVTESSGASVSECRILQRIRERGEPTRIVDLATELGLRSHTVTRAANRLEQRGWVRRAVEPRNRKAVYLVITAEGERAQQNLQAALDSFNMWHNVRHLDPQQRRVAYESSRLFAEKVCEKRSGGPAPRVRIARR